MKIWAAILEVTTILRMKLSIKKNKKNYFLINFSMADNLQTKD